ncbi:response regulator [Pedobacter aquatilis]|uniref:response regulator transcription factor n=1 Tax=Pedobacter aquatilis TaxID=351343 RepID=UPI0025B5359B|nr:response regulator [Pedobacter aquatilis]MDN3586175.1 response regulator [Pedobacter aquatilis]
MKRKIFVLEDDNGIRDILDFLLSEADYEISTFCCIKDLLRAKRNYRPDLFLLDVRLPDGNGVDVCRMLNKNADTAHIPVLMMSADVDANQIGINCKAKAFMAKPFDIHHILDSINFALKSA